VENTLSIRHIDIRIFINFNLYRIYVMTTQADNADRREATGRTQDHAYASSNPLTKQDIQQRIDKTMSTFAKRVATIPRGKTFGWDDESKEITSVIRDVVAAVIGEDYKGSVWNVLRSEQRTRAETLLGGEDNAKNI
jgi:hypothetical protein